MKWIEKLTLTIFSALMLIFSVVMSLIIFGWLEVKVVGEAFDIMLRDSVASNIVLGLSILFILLSIRCIFFTSSEKVSSEYKDGILLENSDGKLLITKPTIENLVSSVVKGFDSAEDVTSRIEIDNENNLNVYVNMTVRENAIIKELTTNLQTKIKETIKKTSDLEVKQVNVKVKNIEPEKTIVQE